MIEEIPRESEPDEHEEQAGEVTPDPWADPEQTDWPDEDLEVE